MPVKAGCKMAKKSDELIEAEAQAEAVQELLDETAGWDDVPQDAIDAFVNAFDSSKPEA